MKIGALIIAASIALAIWSLFGSELAQLRLIISIGLCVAGLTFLVYQLRQIKGTSGNQNQ